MTTAEAIKEINSRIELASRCYVYLVSGYIEALEMAVEALRKQEPMKPNEFHTEPMYYGWHYQGQVRAKAVGMSKDHFCPRCGQAIDWSEE